MPSSVPRTAEATNGNVMVAYDLAESDSEGEFGALPVRDTRARDARPLGFRELIQRRAAVLTVFCRGRAPPLSDAVWGVLPCWFVRAAAVWQLDPRSTATNTTGRPELLATQNPLFWTWGGVHTG